MEIRGERECKECGARWSYYETGSIDCPSCGSLQSRGLGDRTVHTASPMELDLTAARSAAADGTLDDGLRLARERCQEYTRRAGFIDGGVLEPLDDTYLIALELRYVAEFVEHSLRLPDDAEHYVLGLLREGDRDERPNPDAVPDTLHAARGLAYADAVDHYRRELRDWLDNERAEESALDSDTTVRTALGTLDDRVRWVHALDGDVEPRTVERLVHAARDLGTALREDDDGALVNADDRLKRIG